MEFYVALIMNAVCGVLSIMPYFFGVLVTLCATRLALEVFKK